MLSSKRLLQIVMKWQKMASLGRRRIMSTRTSRDAPSIANKGHIFVYSSDGKRFTIPLVYLSHSLFRELFKMAEEEFGLPSDGPITLPCDAVSMARIVSLLRLGESVADGRSSVSSLYLEQHDQQECRSVYGF